MDDLISRQAALDALNNADVVLLYHDGEPIDEVAEEAIWATKRSAKKSIEALPPAQPEEYSCDGCKFCGQFEYQFPCKVCIRREKDYYARPN